MKNMSKRKFLILSKRWITKGLITSITIKKNCPFPSGDTDKYRIYRNKLTTIIRLSKKKLLLRPNYLILS